MNIKRVLIADDSKSARFSLRKKLQALNLDIDVELAESANEALDQLKSKSPGCYPDIIFMDHYMPGMNGFEATRSIKANPQWSNISIIMCTSQSGSDYLEEAKEHGALGILSKPSTQKEIMDAIDHVNTTQAEQRPRSNAAPLTASSQQPSSQQAAPSKASQPAEVQNSALDEERAKALIRDHLSQFQSTLEGKLKSLLSPLVLPLVHNLIKEESLSLIQSKLNEHVEQVNHSTHTEQLTKLETSIDQLPEIEIKIRRLEESLNRQATEQEKQIKQSLEHLSPKIEEIAEKTASKLISPVVEQIATELEKGLHEISNDVKLEIAPWQQSVKQAKKVAGAAIGISLTSVVALIFLL